MTTARRPRRPLIGWTRLLTQSANGDVATTPKTETGPPTCPTCGARIAPIFKGFRSLAAASQLRRIPEIGLRRAIKRGHLRAKKVGSRWWIAYHDLDRWEERRYGCWTEPVD